MLAHIIHHTFICTVFSEFAVRCRNAGMELQYSVRNQSGFSDTSTTDYMSGCCGCVKPWLKPLAFQRNGNPSNDVEEFAS